MQVNLSDHLVAFRDSDIILTFDPLFEDEIAFDNGCRSCVSEIILHDDYGRKF